MKRRVTSLKGQSYLKAPEQGIQALYTDEIALWISAYTDKKYSGRLTTSIDVVDDESILRIIVEDSVDGRIVNFTQEMQPDKGLFALDYNFGCLTAGEKTVRVLLNNVEVYRDAIDVA